MKFINNILSKFGTDRFLHLFLGGWITSLFGLFGWISLIIGIIFVFGISVLKEYKFDDVVDWTDIKFAMYGSLLSTILCIISLFI